MMTYYFDKTLTAENSHSLRRKSSTDEAILLDWWQKQLKVNLLTIISISDSTHHLFRALLS